MAPSAGGHLLVSKSLRVIRFGIEKVARAIRTQLPQATQPFESQAQPVYARVNSRPANRAAAIRQNQSRSYTTRIRTEQIGRRDYATANNASRPSRSSFPSSRTGQAVSRLTSRAPFASTLRPNLTGGALSRTSGGYNVGAGRVHGARYFSHTPASPAEVIQNVSQAVRAFWLSGQKAHFDGYHPRSGEKRFRAVSSHQDTVRTKLDTHKADAPGSFVDFRVSPTITAIGPLSMVPRSDVQSSSLCEFDQNEGNTIANVDILTTLEVDFARALKDLAAIMNDLKHLATLGALPMSLVGNTTLRVRFPGCDAETVEAICRELNIRRGIVGEDDNFHEYVGAEMALLFPFAPSHAPSEANEELCQHPAKRQKQDRLDWRHMMSPAQPISLVDSHELPKSDHWLEDAEVVENPWLSTGSGYSSLRVSSEDAEVDVAAMFFRPPPAGRQFRADAHREERDDDVLAYEGVQGIYRFIGECEQAQR